MESVVVKEVHGAVGDWVNAAVQLVLSYQAEDPLSCHCRPCRSSGVHQLRHAFRSDM